MKKMDSKVWALVIFSGAFAVIYKFSLWYAAGLGNVSSFVFSFEKNIPFIPWTIIPYLSSGVFFCVIFFIIRSEERLRVFLKRVLLMTALAGIGFIAMPLQYSYPRPEVSNPIFNSLFWLLDGFDDPYNQSPSLHVAFAFAFWTVFRELKAKWKPIAAVWLILVALSTLTTYQHHLIDVFAGSMLAHFTFIVFPSQQRSFGFRNLHAANFCFFAGWSTVTASFLLAEFYGSEWLNFNIIALIMFAVGYFYQRDMIGYVRREAVRISVFKNLF